MVIVCHSMQSDPSLIYLHGCANFCKEQWRWCDFFHPLVREQRICALLLQGEKLHISACRVAVAEKRYFNE